jgi:hypothetical protein
MTLRHWDSLLTGDGDDGALDLSDGITFGQDDTYQISQENAASGTEPAEATITGQGASLGDALPGGALVLAGGDPGAAGQLAGDVVVQVGEAVATTTAALKIKTLGDEIMSLMQRGGLAAVRAGGALALQLYSASAVSLVAGNTGVSLMLSEDGALAIAFTERVTIADGQLVLSPAGSIPASGGITLDFDVAAKWAYVINGNVTFNAPQNVVDGATYTIRIEQAAPGGFTASWNSVFKFGALSGTLTATSGAIDIFVFEAGSAGDLHCISAAKGVHA